MAKNLKKSIRQKKSNQGPQKELKIPKGKEAQAQQLEKQMQQFSGKSEGDLMEQLMAEVQKGKQDGTFTDESLSAFIKNVSPMLNAQQKQKLQSLTQKIK